MAKIGGYVRLRLCRNPSNPNPSNPNPSNLNPSNLNPSSPNPRGDFS